MGNSNFHGYLITPFSATRENWMHVKN